MADDGANITPLKGREIIVAVCGGIAAYKVADVVSKLVQSGAGVSASMLTLLDIGEVVAGGTAPIWPSAFKER